MHYEIVSLSGEHQIYRFRVSPLAYCDKGSFPRCVLWG